MIDDVARGFLEFTYPTAAASAPVAGSGVAAAPVAGGGGARPPGINDGKKPGAEGRNWVRNLGPSTPIVCTPSPKRPTEKSYAR